MDIWIFMWYTDANDTPTVKLFDCWQDMSNEAFFFMQETFKYIAKFRASHLDADVWDLVSKNQAIGTPDALDEAEEAFNEWMDTHAPGEREYISTFKAGIEPRTRIVNGKLVKTPNQPEVGCKRCGKNVTVGESTCWWCGIADPGTKE